MTWTEVLKPIKESDYFKNLREKVKIEFNSSQCFPPKNEIFRALELTEFEEVKVVIIGQDPYQWRGGPLSQPIGRDRPRHRDGASAFQAGAEPDSV